MEVTYGVAGDDDHEALHDLGRHAFASDRPYDPEAPAVPDDRVRVARIAGQPVGKVVTFGFGQWINGASVPMAGVSGVAVAAHVAGRGVAKRLLDEALHDAAGRGELIASLFPTTASLYRSVGFEIAGGWGRRAVPMSDVRTDVADGISVEPAPVESLASDREVYDRHARRSNGWLDRSDLWFSRMVWFERRDGAERHLKVYRARRGDDVIAVGAVTSSTPSTYAQRLYDFRCDQLWGDAEGIRAIGAVVTGHSTTAGELLTLLPRHQLDALTAQPQRVRSVEEWPWMTRLLDLEAAMAARPTPAFDGEVHARVHDPVFSGNDGAWVFCGRDGRLHAERGGRGDIDIGVGDLAALYTGFQTPYHLASLGRLPGADERSLAAMTTALRASDPWMVDFF